MIAQDLSRVRELAKRQLELSKSERNLQLYKDWELHGKVDGTGRPMLTVELGTFWGDIIPPQQICESPEGRNLEGRLLGNLANFELFHDDTPMRGYLGVSHSYGMTPFGLSVIREESGGLGHHFVSQFEDLAADFGKLGPSILNKRVGDADRQAAFLEDSVGDILPIRRTGQHFYFSPMGDVTRLMGMQNMFIAMCDEPELFHRMMEMYTKDAMALMDAEEADGILLPTTGDMPLTQGTFCFNDDLPSTGTAMKMGQIWGYLDSQETSGVSPEMYHEFVYPYYKRISERYGLLSYGCCEGVDPVWEKSVSQFKNLRKVSISPWCDEEYMGAALQKRKVVFLRKPSPNYIGVDRYLDEDAVRAAMTKTVAAAKGLTLEFSQRDVYTVHSDIGKVRRYVELIREACEGKR
jgi:hypothetical protein